MAQCDGVDPSCVLCPSVLLLVEAVGAAVVHSTFGANAEI